MARILVIDDDGVVRDALEVFLTRAGHSVTTAADGGNGVAAFKRAAPDLVVLDRDLPVISGSGVLRKIRELSPGVPVIMLTGYDAADAADKYLESGATAFLSKKDGLLNVLNEIDSVLGVGKEPPPPVTAAPPAQRPAPAAPAPAPAPAPAASRGKGLVLVIDDDEVLSEALRRVLSSYGYEVLTAPDGESGAAQARARRPDIVLLDIAMPRKDGVAVLRELVAELPKTGFIMLSGSEDDQVAKACLKIGAFDYLSKPPNMGALETVISACLLVRA